MFAIRRVAPIHSGAWANLRHLLWPEASVSEHAEEIAQFFAGGIDEPQAVFIAESSAGEIIGFVELSIRHQVTGCASDRIGFIEGLFVAPAQRRLGVVPALVRIARAWALESGCREFATDRAERFIVDRQFNRRG